MKKLIGFVALVALMALFINSTTAMAQDAPPATPGDYEAGISTPDIENPTKPGTIRMPDFELNLGAGYYNSSKGAHGVTAEGNFVWTHFVGADGGWEGVRQLIGLKLSPGVRATAAFDFTNKNLDNIEVLVPLGSLFGVRSMIDGPNEDEITAVIDVSLASNGFAFRRDTDLEQTDFGYDARVAEFYFHVAREKFDIFGGFYFGRFIVGKNSNISEEYTCLYSAFGTDFGFGIKARPFADIRFAGGASQNTGTYDTFDANSQKSIQRFENGQKPNDETSYLSGFKTSATGGFYSLFGSPISLYYKYAWEMARDGDLRPGTMNEMDTTERFVHRHMAILSWAY